MAAADRLEALYRQAGPEIIRTGRGWYDHAQRAADELSRDLPRGCGRIAAAGIIAALSPRLRWGHNLAAARAIAEGRPRSYAFGDAWRKAQRIRDGERPTDVLRGPKVRAFWRAVAGDPNAVTIDVWAARAAGLPDKPSPGAISEAQGAYREAAERCGESPRDFQAIVWLIVRGAKPTDPPPFHPTLAV